LKKSVLLVLVGISLVAVGAALSAVTTQRSRKINLAGEWVNGTRVMDLGVVNEGDKIRLAFRTWSEEAEMRNILITLMRSDTGEIIPERRYPLQIEELYWNSSQNGYTAWGEYFPPATAGYEFLLSWAYPGREPNPIKLVTFDVFILGPAETPYLLPGAGTAIAGVLLLVVGFVKRRSAKTGGD